MRTTNRVVVLIAVLVASVLGLTKAYQRHPDGAGMTIAPPQSALGQTLDLDELTQASDAIIVGRASVPQLLSTTSTQTASGMEFSDSMSALLETKVVLKGVPRGNVSFRFVNLRGRPANSLSTTKDRIFFFRQTNDGLGPANAYHLSVIGRIPFAALSADAIENVVSAIASVIDAPDSTETSKVEAINTLHRTVHSSAATAVRRALGDPALAVRIAAATVLLYKDDLSGLPLAREVLSSPQAYGSGTAEVFRAAIEAGLKDEGAIPDLQEWARSKDARTRVAAMRGLRNTNSQLAVRDLAQGLNDDDRDVRYAAVAGLAVITSQRQRQPSAPRFATDEGPWIDYWRDWARTRGLIK